MTDLLLLPLLAVVIGILSGVWTALKVPDSCEPVSLSALCGLVTVMVIAGFKLAPSFEVFRQIAIFYACFVVGTLYSLVRSPAIRPE